jgi:nucleoside-diphosphate-sugar epimerase
MKTILLTGAHGFIGQKVVRSLEQMSFKVLSPKKTELDLLNASSVAAYFSRNKPDILIHTAWYTEHGQFWNSPENQRWLEATVFLAECFAQAGGKRILALGTCAEYFWTPAGKIYEPHEADLKISSPLTMYGQKKLELLEKLKSLSQKKNIELIWGRIFFPFGEHEKESRVIPLMMKALIKKQSLSLSSGRQIRDFMCTDDIGELIAVAATSQSSAIVPGQAQVFNFGSGKGTSLREIGKILCQIASADSALLDFQNRPLNEPEILVGSITGRYEIFNWKARTTLEEGLKKTYQWWTERLKK